MSNESMVNPTIPVRYSLEKIGQITYHNEFHDTIVHPEGFESVYLYKSKRINSKNIQEIATQVTDTVKENTSKVRFCIKDGYPALPLIEQEEIWHEGWDIPTEYAIDGNKQCWMNNAHGGSLCKVAADHLVSSFEVPEMRLYIERLLGLKESFTTCPCCGSLVAPDRIKT